MKLSLILAAIAVSAQAGREFKPKVTPRSMRGEHTPRYVIEDDEKVGTHAIDVDDELALGHTELCIKEAQLFDEYCHQYKLPLDSKKTPRYADFTDGTGDCGMWESADGSPVHEEGHCLAQECMF